MIPTINAVKTEILKLNAAIIRSSVPAFDFKEIDFTTLNDKIKTPHRNAVRMLLKMLAYEEQKELLPQKWEIEHIFPQRWQSNYFTNIGDDIVKEKIEHIGNKIPFEKHLNIIAGNGYFTKKKKIYADSSIMITKIMASSKKDDWKLDDISERDVRVSDCIITTLEKWNKEYLKEYVCITYKETIS